MNIIWEDRSKITDGIKIINQQDSRWENILHYPNGPKVIIRVFIWGKGKQKSQNWSGNISGKTQLAIADFENGKWLWAME